MLLIFDWDGTLCDSKQKIAQCMVLAAKQCQLPSLAPEAVYEIIGLGLPEAIRRLFPRAGQSDIDNMRAAYSTIFVEQDTTPAEMFDGAEEVLRELRQQGAQLAVATGKSRKGLDRILRDLSWGHVFHGSRCADETQSKPHPQMLHELLEEFDCAAEDAVMIGDTEFDMEMAQRAGVPRVAVSFGAHHINRLKAYEPAGCIDSLRQLPNVL